MRKLKKGDVIICNNDKDRDNTYKALNDVGIKCVRTWKDNKLAVEIVEDEK